MGKPTFDDTFEALTGNKPFPWLRELYQRFITDRPDNIPASCNIPTGLGKTSVIAVWLIALATDAAKIPRRLVYVVNRRTVVDQTTNEIEKLRNNLEVAGLGEPLKSLCALPTERPLSISTLRGQFADNREWSADPARPAVICGTVDMIGSRLLFSGYGVGKARPLHAGFLGQDALLVHDEAHLEPAFQELLIEIEKEQQRCKEFARFRVLELSATSRSTGEPHRLSEENYSHAEVKKRIDAKKAIHLIENKDEKRLADELAEVALKFKESDRAILVFVRKVDDMEKIVSKLMKERLPVQQLSGTIRGLERNLLVDDPIFKRFLPNAAPGTEIVYLVCTSAGEVGVNISADHMVCDLSTFDSMAQRFGRVNRFGERPDTEIHIVYPSNFDEESDYESRRKKTLELLRLLNGDGSPSAIDKLDPEARKAAFAPTPIILPVSDILFDAWALTSIRGKLPGRPAVAPYLHGIASWEPPETHVAWREEVDIIVGDLLSTYDPNDLLDDYPLKPHELLRDNTSRVYDRLKKFDQPPETPVWIMAEDEFLDVTTLGEIIEVGKDALNYKTVLLPPSAGGLQNGMLTSDSPIANDVADEWRDEKGTVRRLRMYGDDPYFDEKRKGMRQIRPPIDRKPDADGNEQESTGRRFWYWFELPKAGDGEGSKANTKPVAWDVHTQDVCDNARGIGKALGLAKELQDAIDHAASFHDLGKKRVLWQRSIGNSNSTNWLAKSGAK